MDHHHSKPRRIFAVAALALLLSVAAAPAQAAFNDQYVYSTTRAVNDMNTYPALKVTLYPATIILDTAFLPFAVIAGFVTA